jgi:hypothetical protein
MPARRRMFFQITIYIPASCVQEERLAVLVFVQYKIEVAMREEKASP